MDKHFLQLRGQGCNGIWNIFQKARTLFSDPHTPADPVRPCSLLLTDSEAWQTPFWEKAATLAGFTLSHLSGVSQLGNGHQLSGQLAIIGGFDDKILSELATNAGVTIINAGNEHARPCQVMADMLAAVTRLGPDADRITEVRISWIGGADGENAGYVHSWLDLALCFQHELFLSFPQGREPSPEPLDFAMNAGAKIFLTYDPTTVLDGAHALIAAPWSPSASSTPAGAITPRHPLLFDTAMADAASKLLVLPVPSVALPIPSSDQQLRDTCLVACQAALLEYLVEKD